VKDVQSSRDHRNIEIDKVGVKNVKYPLWCWTRRTGFSTPSRRSAYVSLPHDYKGTHMSRFVEILHGKQEHDQHMGNLPDILREMKQKLDAESAHLEVTFLIIKKDAPVSRTPATWAYLRLCRPHGKDDTMKNSPSP
jgi:GTP cyclohydrolase I